MTADANLERHWVTTSTLRWWRGAAPTDAGGHYGAVLQQRQIDIQTGAKRWRDVPVVREDPAEANRG